MRQRARAHLNRDPVNASEHFIVVEDFFCSLFCVTDNKRPFRTTEDVEVGSSDRRPSAFLADLAEHPLIAGEVIIAGFLGC